MPPYVQIACIFSIKSLTRAQFLWMSDNKIWTQVISLAPIPSCVTSSKSLSRLMDHTDLFKFSQTPINDNPTLFKESRWWTLRICDYNSLGLGLRSARPRMCPILRALDISTHTLEKRRKLKNYLRCTCDSSPCQNSKHSGMSLYPPQCLGLGIILLKIAEMKYLKNIHGCRGQKTFRIHHTIDNSKNYYCIR